VIIAAALFGTLCVGFFMDSVSGFEDSDESNAADDELYNQDAPNGLWPWEEEVDWDEEIDWQEETVPDQPMSAGVEDENDHMDGNDQTTVDQVVLQNDVGGSSHGSNAPDTDQPSTDPMANMNRHGSGHVMGNENAPTMSTGDGSTENGSTPVRLTDDDDYYIGTSDAEHIIGRQGNDTIFGNGGVDTLVGWAGNDVLVSHGSGGHLSGNTDDDYLEARKTSFGQYHLHGGDGEDTLVMHLDNQSGWGNQGFHAYGGDEADEFRFVGAGTADSPLVSRLDDFDASQDSIWVDDVEIDLNALPADMRVVDYLGQQWLVVDDNAIVGLEAVRMNAPEGVPTLPGGNIELHFHAFPTNLADLPTVAFVNQ
jgi:Ca2+-binding RTX toxin-like protein